MRSPGTHAIVPGGWTTLLEARQGGCKWKRITVLLNVRVLSETVALALCPRLMSFRLKLLLPSKEGRRGLSRGKTRSAVATLAE
jgi:hypothetical protein